MKIPSQSRQKMMRQIRKRGQIVQRLKEEALALAEQENIPIPDATRFVRGDFDIRKEIRLAVSMAPEVGTTVSSPPSRPGLNESA
jgi:hypothetical protein